MFAKSSLPLAALLMAASLGLAAPAGAQSYNATFDFFLSGIRAGELEFTGEKAGGRYTASSTIRSAGLVGVFADFFFDGTATGSVTGSGKVVPERFVARSKSPRAERDTRIDWQAGTPVSVSVEPPRSSAPDPAAQAGTLDPVSAGFALFRDSPAGEICNTQVDVFDGSRRSRLVLGAPVAGSGGEISCAGRYARIEGEAHSMSARQDHGFRLVFRATDAGLARLERIEAPTGFGTAVAERRR